MNAVEYIQSHETLIRLSVFFGVFVLMAGLEAGFARKKRTQSRLQRWPTNLGIVALYTVLLRVLFPIAAIGTALFAQSKGYGLLNQFALPIWGHIVISMVLLDLAIYLQHVASHKIGIFWQFHKVHHADRDIDVTTGARFHPVEIILSMLYKMLIVLLIGPHAVGVLLFEVVLNGSAMFNHANVKLPFWLDRVVRFVIVTPDMHRVHHSVYRTETDSNYGFNLSIWDRLFRTYIAQPVDGHDKMTIGLPIYQSDKPANLLWCLTLPFKSFLPHIHKKENTHENST